MSDSYLENASTGMNFFREIMSALNHTAYGALSMIYQLFFNVTKVDLFSNEAMFNFYGRIQLIIGVFMMFQFTVTILRGIIEPNTFMGADKEKSGARNIITRVLIALVLFTVIIPISIPNPRNEYEKQIRNNGLLFGTLFSLQHRILANNTIGKLVLGTGTSTASYLDDDDGLKEVSNTFSTTILRTFYKINLIPEEERDYSGGKDKAKDPALYADFRLCKNVNTSDLASSTDDDTEKSDYVTIYFTTNNPSEILAMSKFTCATAEKHGLLSKITSGVADKFSGKNYYFLVAHSLFAFVTAVIFMFIFLSFTVDVAVRAIKLAVLRLIAPIPIISYMDPKGGKDSAFSHWVKLLISTYLDLFIRLAVVYFVLFLIQDMINEGMTMFGKVNGPLSGITFVLICIALFIFAKQAPKFIRQALGLKDDKPFNLFGGLEGVMSAGAVGAGAVSGAVSRAVGTYEANGRKNLGKAALAGIAGGIGGGINAGKTYFNGKDVKHSDIMNKVRAYNTKNYSNAADDSTFRGRFMAGLQSNVGLKTNYEKLEDKIKYFGAADDAMSRVNKAFNNNGDYKISLSDKFMQDLKDKGDANKRNYQFDSSGNLLDKDRKTVVLRAGQDYSLKQLNDINERYSSSDDADLRDALDEAKKQAQGIRFTAIRKEFGGEGGRARLIEQIEAEKDKKDKKWTQNDLVALDAGQTIWSVAQKFDDPFFSKLRDADSYGETGASWGDFKFAASNAGRTKDQIKNSPEYFTAKSNNQRAEQNNNKK